MVAYLSPLIQVGTTGPFGEHPRQVLKKNLKGSLGGDAITTEMLKQDCYSVKYRRCRDF